LFIDLTRVPILQRYQGLSVFREALTRLVTGGALLLFLSFSSLRGSLPGFCLVNRLTGVPCPFCGVTRSCGLALSGHFDESIHMHPAGMLVVGALTTQVVVYGQRVLRNSTKSAPGLRTIEFWANNLIVAVCIGHWFVVVLPSLVRR
jgi:hypothetical protein